MKQSPYWKPQHEVFIRHMLCHEDATKAYHAAYPKASKTSARIGGIRLNNYPHIRERIQPILEQRHEEANTLAMQQALNREKQQAARCDHLRTVIAAIARKEIKKDRHFIVNGETITLQEDIAHGSMLALLSLDLKLAEGYDNWEAIERQFTTFTRNTSPKIEIAHCNEAQSMVLPLDCPSTDDQLQSGGQGVNGGQTRLLEKRQQTVINSDSNPIPETVSANGTNLENLQKTDNKTTPDNKFQDLERTSTPHLRYTKRIKNAL